MRKLTALTLAVLLLLASVSTPASAAFEPETNYMQQMIHAACTGDVQAGLDAEAMRMEKIEALGLDAPPVSFEDLYLLAKVMYAEAGSAWLSDEWRMCVGEVVLNRVASPEFPNTVREVIEQPGQYYGPDNDYFEQLLPSEACVHLALRLLEGERVIDEPSVVFQANFPLGSGTFLELYDSQLGTTYLCYSSYPELYPA